MIFRGLSAKFYDSCQFSTKTPKTMLSFLSSNKRSRRVPGKLYKNLRGKQNKGYVLAMEKQPIARNNRLNSSTIAPRRRGDKASLYHEILLEMCFRQRFERSLENKISRQRKSFKFETIGTRIQPVDVIRFHSNAIRSWQRWFSSDIPCKWRQRYHPKSKGDQFTSWAVWKGHSQIQWF